MPGLEAGDITPEINWLAVWQEDEDDDELIENTVGLFVVGWLVITTVVYFMPHLAKDWLRV